MKTLFLALTAFLTLSAAAYAESCIPSSSNPGGCMGIPDTLSASEETDRDAGGTGRDSGGTGRDSGGTGSEEYQAE